MTAGKLLAGLIVVLVGVVLYYCLLPKVEKTEQKPIITGNVKKTVPSLLGSIFILLGLLSILQFCFGIDGSNYTPEKEDDMTILNGVAIVICSFSIERHISIYLKKLKAYRHSQKANRDE